MKARSHLVISDCQVKPTTNNEHLKWIGNYIAEKRPDVIVCLGDFADMPSLSSYDTGKKCFEGRRYKDDIEAARDAMFDLVYPWPSNYKPKMHLTLGNHEDRITRAVEQDAKLDGTLTLADLEYEKAGWKVHPFLQPVVLDGIAYAHYFVTGIMGRPVTSASALLSKRHMSAIMGHVQRREIAYASRADGRQMTAIFAGSTYTHNEDYLGAQGNHYWRGLWILHEVHDGSFDEMPVSLAYLKRRYS